MSKHLESIEFPEIGKYDTDHLARIDGYYEDLTSGTTEQILSNMFIEDNAPYKFRTAGGSLEIADRETDMLVGGSVAFNQLIQNGNFANGTTGYAPMSGSYGTISASNGELTYTLSIVSSDNYTNTVQVPQFIRKENHKYFTHYECYLPKASKLNKSYLSGQNVVVDGSVGWNILESVIKVPATVTGTWYLGIANPSNYSEMVVGDSYKIKNVFCIDLTALFGTTIADYIYSLENANAGDGVAWFKRYFPNDYYPYNAGSIESVSASAHKMTGFNQWDEEWESGTYNWTTGEKGTSPTRIRCKNFIPVFPNTTYYFKITNDGADIHFYDINNVHLDKAYFSGSRTYTIPSNAYYVTFSTQPAYGKTYKNDICINLHWDGERDGEYESYKEWVYPLDSDLELRGIPKLDTDGNLVYDGDTYESDGTVTRRFRILHLGDSTWTKNDTPNNHWRFIATTGNANAPKNNNAICSKYVTISAEDVYGGNLGIAMNYAYNQIVVCDESYSDATAFKTAMNGVYLVYELATPTTESADTFTNPQIVDNWGTEEYVTTSVVPVGHITKYPPDLKAKLEVAPESPDADGLYLMHRESGQNSYAQYVPQDISGKANIDGYYEDMTVGRSENFVTNLSETESEPFTFRTSGGNLEIGDREELTVGGGSLPWNQLVNPSNRNYYNATATFVDNTAEFTATAKGGRVHYIFNIISGHKYLCSTKVQTATATSDIYLSWYGGSNKKGIATAAWQNIETVFAAGSTSNNWQLQIVDNRTSGWDKVSVKETMAFDLTQMFGSTIADYIYNLEQTTAGAGVAFFKKYFLKDYYPYNAGEMLHVQTSEFKTVGFNQFDKSKATVGKYINGNGVETSNSNKAHSDFIPVIPSMSYYTNGYAGQSFFSILAFTKDKQAMGTWYGGASKDAPFYVTLPSNCYYVVLNFNKEQLDDVCFHIHWDETRDGEYEPYNEHSYPLDDSLTLRGIPKLDADNNLYFDGDIYEHDGTVTRRFKEVTFNGTESGWEIYKYGSSEVISFKKSISDFGSVERNCATDKFVYTAFAWAQSTQYGIFGVGGKNAYFRPPNASITTVEEWKTWLASNPVTFVYAVATPTTEEAEPYQTPQIVDNWGTEEFVVPTQSGVEIPVGHETVYPISLRDKLESAPNLPDGDGDYIMRMNSGEASYVQLASQFPALPTENGNYVLKATVTNGTATLTWEAQS